MARIPQVTRTITSTKATALCVNTNAETLEKITFTLTRTYKDDKEMLKMINKVNDNPDLVATRILEKEEVQTLYAMLETDFIKYAKPVDKIEETSEDVEG